MNHNGSGVLNSGNSGLGVRFDLLPGRFGPFLPTHRQSGK